MNPFGPKLIQFEDGKYGVRVFWFFCVHFVDLNLPSVCWTPSDKYFSDCKGTREKAERALNFRLNRAKYKIVR